MPIVGSPVVLWIMSQVGSVPGTCTPFWHVVNWTQRNVISFLAVNVNGLAVLVADQGLDDLFFDGVHHTRVGMTSFVNESYVLLTNRDLRMPRSHSVDVDYIQQSGVLPCLKIVGTRF